MSAMKNSINQEPDNYKDPSEEIKIIILGLKDRGLKQKEIAEVLNAQGFKTCRGKLFTQALVSYEEKKFNLNENSFLPIDDNFIYERNGKIFSDSRYIAKTFEKDHKNVLRDIENLIKKESDLKNNFEQIFFVDNLNRNQPIYLMDKIGFSVLAMGFTGSKALKFKLSYAKKFDEMEKEINSRFLPAPQKELTRTELALMVIESEKLIEFEKGKRLLAEKAESIANEKTQIVINHLEKVKPKVALYDAIANSENLRTLKQLGYKLRKYGLGPNKVFDWLRHKGVLTLVGGVNYPTAKYDKHFKTVSKNKKITRLDGTEKVLTFDILFLLPSAYNLVGELAITDGYISLSNWSQLDMTDLPKEDLNNEFQFSEIKGEE